MKQYLFDPHAEHEGLLAKAASGYAVVQRGGFPGFSFIKDGGGEVLDESGVAGHHDHEPKRLHATFRSAH